MNYKKETCVKLKVKGNSRRRNSASRKMFESWYLYLDNHTKGLFYLNTNDSDTNDAGCEDLVHIYKMKKNELCRHVISLNSEEYAIKKEEEAKNNYINIEEDVYYNSDIEQYVDDRKGNSVDLLSSPYIYDRNINNSIGKCFCFEMKKSFNSLMYLDNHLSYFYGNKKEEMGNFLQEYNKKRFEDVCNRGLLNNFKSDIYEIGIYEENIVSFKLLDCHNRHLIKNTYYMNADLIFNEIHNLLNKMYPLKHIMNNHHLVKKYQKKVPEHLKMEKALKFGIVLDFDYVRENFENNLKKTMTLLDFLIILDKIWEIFRQNCVIMFLHVCIFKDNDTNKDINNHRKRYSYMYEDLKNTLDLLKQKGIPVVMRINPFQSFRLFNHNEFSNPFIQDVNDLYMNEQVDHIILVTNDSDVISYSYNFDHTIIYCIKDKYKNVTNVPNINSDINVDTITHPETTNNISNHYKNHNTIMFKKPVILICSLNNLPLKNNKIHDDIILDDFCYMTYIIKTLYFRFQSRSIRNMLKSNLNNTTNFVINRITQMNNTNRLLKNKINVLLLDDIIYKIRPRKENKNVSIHHLLQKAYSPFYYPIHYYIKEKCTYK
ncbi:cytoadherence-linked protein [Plasmodium falciparum HB3]|uniref:Cytoadherence-linked protein n=2 Tax=Plasmodium falciparum TaxID=5833 RepID=A0A0L7KAR7_PLAFX|nr:cytoadherence-linked protein [Plasmodium falciparum HB3]